jgi:myosin heavy subunit
MQFVYAKVFEWLVDCVNRTLFLKEVLNLLELLVHKYKN